MQDKIFIDTNIIAYSFDNQNPTKQKTAKKLLEEFFDKDNYFVSIQVLNEFSSVALKKLNPPLSVEQIKEFISSFPKRKILPVNRDTVLASLVIVDKYKLSYWDSLIIASAFENHCIKLYSEDMQGGQIIDDKLQIINPFNVLTDN